MKPVTLDESGVVDRRVLLAERDAARADRALLAAQADIKSLVLALDLLKLETANQMRLVKHLEGELQLLYASTSWRWSAPVRQVSGIVQRLRASMGGPAPKPLPSPKPVATVPELPVMLSVRERAILHRLQRGG